MYAASAGVAASFSAGRYCDHCWLNVRTADSCVWRSAAGLPVTKPAGSGVQPMRPPPPSPSDSGLPFDSWYMFPAMPAAALSEYPLASRKLTIAVTFSGSSPSEVSQVTDVAVAFPVAGAVVAVGDEA